MQAQSAMVNVEKGPSRWAYLVVQQAITTWSSAAGQDRGCLVRVQVLTLLLLHQSGPRRLVSIQEHFLHHNCRAVWLLAVVSARGACLCLHLPVQSVLKHDNCVITDQRPSSRMQSLRTLPSVNLYRLQQPPVDAIDVLALNIYFEAHYVCIQAEVWLKNNTFGLVKRSGR